LKIRIAKNLYVDSRTLFRIEWRKWYPALVVHEKYETIVKWTLRIIAFIGISSSVIAIPVWYVSLIISIGIFLIEQFFERALFEYTAMVVQPFPDFDIDYSQWKTNGFMIPEERNGTDFAHFGPTYMDEEYAIKFFKYLRSWVNDNSNDDKENNLVTSIVIEPNEEYTTYIYANIGRRRLDQMFRFIEMTNKLDKYGKRQQNLIMQLHFWHTLKFKDGYYVKKFLEYYKPEEPFIFTPSVVQPFGFPPKFLFNSSIKKYHIKIKERKEIKKNEPEYHFDPAKWKKKDRKSADDEIKEKVEVTILADIQKVLSKAVDVGFMPNHENSAGALNLCYPDCEIQLEAYKQLIKQADKKEVNISIKDNKESIDLIIQLTSIDDEIHLNNLPFNRAEFKRFLEVDGGGNQIVLLVGYPPANEKKIRLDKGISPLVVTWKVVK
jgi:hypothetical protein